MSVGNCVERCEALIDELDREIERLCKERSQTQNDFARYRKLCKRVQSLRRLRGKSEGLLAELLAEQEKEFWS